jgi:hypothetical protein
MTLLYGILIIIVTFIIAMVVASLVTPAILMGLEIVIEKLAKKPKNETNKRCYRVYIPYPIQYLRSLLNFHNRKSRIIQPNKIKDLNYTNTEPSPKEAPYSVSKPVAKSGVNPNDDAMHGEKIISKHQPNANKTVIICPKNGKITLRSLEQLYYSDIVCSDCFRGVRWIWRLRLAVMVLSKMGRG